MCRCACFISQIVGCLNSDCACCRSPGRAGRHLLIMALIGGRKCCHGSLCDMLQRPPSQRCAVSEVRLRPCATMPPAWCADISNAIVEDTRASEHTCLSQHMCARHSEACFQNSLVCICRPTSQFDCIPELMELWWKHSKVRWCTMAYVLVFGSRHTACHAVRRGASELPFQSVHRADSHRCTEM